MDPMLSAYYNRGWEGGLTPLFPAIHHNVRRNRQNQHVPNVIADKTKEVIEIISGL
jgi:hypothetical protein